MFKLCLACVATIFIEHLLFKHVIRKTIKFKENCLPSQKEIFTIFFLNKCQNIIFNYCFENNVFLRTVLRVLKYCPLARPENIVLEGKI